MSLARDSHRRSPEGLVRRIVGTFRPYWPVVTLVGLLILITAGLGVVNPVLIRVVFDSANAVDIKAEEARGRVTFDSVRLRYGSTDGDGADGKSSRELGQQWALDGVSLRCRPGSWPPLLASAGRARRL